MTSYFEARFPRNRNSDHKKLLASTHHLSKLCHYFVKKRNLWLDLMIIIIWVSFILILRLTLRSAAVGFNFFLMIMWTWFLLHPKKKFLILIMYSWNMKLNHFKKRRCFTFFENIDEYKLHYLHSKILLKNLKIRWKLCI